MRLMHYHESPWVWQAPSWPNLTYDAPALAHALAAARVAQGKLMGKADMIGFRDTGISERDLWVAEAMATAAIESERLDIASVRSSVARRLGVATPIVAVPRDVEGLLDVMEAAVTDWNADLTESQLRGWQAALFPVPSVLREIATGRYRTHSEPMQIVSGAVGRERLHYEAPPSANMRQEMAQFLAWFNATRESAANLDGLVRAGLCHLWFEILHPFEDGNGRIGRAIMDRALAQDARRANRFHGVSVEMLKRQADYYAALNQASRSTGDVTQWLLWFIDTFSASCETAAKAIEATIIRARFWADHQAVPLNQRQRKALTALLDAGPDQFLGGMTARKYQSLTGTTGVTATRDLAGLAGLGLLLRQGAGRSTYYDLAILGWQRKE